MHTFYSSLYSAHQMFFTNVLHVQIIHLQYYAVYIVDTLLPKFKKKTEVVAKIPLRPVQHPMPAPPVDPHTWAKPRRQCCWVPSGFGQAATPPEESEELDPSGFAPPPTRPFNYLTHSESQKQKPKLFT